MGVRIEINQDFPFPVEKLFADLTDDHAKLGRILGAKMKHLVDGKESRAGVGSVRQVGPKVLGIQETVLKIEPNELVEYSITKGGGPLKNHLGRMTFSAKESGSHLRWVITFDMKLGFGLLGPVIKKGLQTGIEKGLAKHARR